MTTKQLIRNIPSEMLESYLTCAKWTSYPEVKTDSIFSTECIKILEDKLRQFLTMFDAAYPNGIDNSDEEIGHDIWLTQNHHRCGFWDGDYEKSIGDKLTYMAHCLGEINLYIGDDGLVYCM